MDEWQLEMQEIERNISALRARDGDPVVIDELEAELRILKSLYLTAGDVFDAGLDDSRLRLDFEQLGLGTWTFQNVYTFVYERALEIETGRRELSSLVPEQDYPDMIRRLAG
ncbi:MAG TPA: hypothetical protein VNV65_12595 [Candidatus Solibacter sp.]|jgi:hypothetical protein|nr:hypothetical protein [Candidatus Solibacter sp.]